MNQSFLHRRRFLSAATAEENDGGSLRFDGARENLTGSNRSLFPSFFAEAPGELGWVLTLVIVSLVSAGIGAVVMVTLLHCRRSVRQRLHTPLSPSPPLSQQNFEPYSILIQRSNIANCSQFLPIIAVLNAQLYHRMLLQYRYGEKEKERERGGDSSG